MNPDRGANDLYQSPTDGDPNTDTRENAQVNDSSDGELDCGGLHGVSPGGMQDARAQLTGNTNVGGYRQFDSVRRPGVFGGDYTGFGGRTGDVAGSRRDDVPAHITDDCKKESLPPLFEHEVEFSVKDALSYSAGQSVRSPSQVVGNFRYRLLIFPSGTHSTSGQQVSAFVEADPLEELDSRWVFHGVKYQITCVNWLDYRRSVTKVDTWTFSKDGIDRGWHDMVRASELTPELGWLGPENTLYFRAACYVRQADGININNDFNFRKETGFIGLKNHGATCYMNGLLQSLFHVGEFRRIVYAIDCDDSPDSPGKGDDPDAEIKGGGSGDADGDVKAPPLIQALQNVFYKLQTSDQAVNCRELMKSFGWDTMDAFTQHDAQELNRILCDRLEEQMKGTPMDGSIKRLFEGEMENYIECIDVDYKSKRNETFYDIQLNIKGERGQELQNIEESFRDFTAEETLEGDNAYEAEGHGKQRAKKGIRFLTFPPVLNLQLKRFHFDLEKMDMVKLNSNFEFQRCIDLSQYAPGAGKYVLHAVVVHSGDVNSGHYYAHIRPTLEHNWFKFDDDTVTPCSEYAAVEDNYGGNDFMVWNYFDKTPRELYHMQPPTRPRIHNAYMLVYIREDCAAEVLRTPDPRVTNMNMVNRCDREVRMAEQRRLQKMEQQLKIRIKLVFEQDLCKMNGFWDHLEIVERHRFKVNRDQLVKELMTDVEQIADVPRAHLAFFSLQYRNNPRQVRFAFMQQQNTFRSYIPQVNAPHFDTSDPYLTVLVVASRGYDIQTMQWAPKTDASKPPDELVRWHDEQVILLIVKYFCPQNRIIVTLGAYYTSNGHALLNMVTENWVSDRLKQYVDRKEVAPPPDDENTAAWECWEEFSERDIQPRSVKRSVKSEQLWSGDVIIWQPVSAREGDTDAAAEPQVDDGVPMYPVNNVADYAAYLTNSIDVVVTLHDPRQPLCVDGVVSNGYWSKAAASAARPQSAQREAKKGDSPTNASKEERPEDEALQLSRAEFRMPQEMELKMDLRWHVNHVTGMIARAFGLKPQTGEAQVWLFLAAPSSSCEEPLNAHTLRTEQATLKELQRNVMYVSPAKKPLLLHAVELPFQPGRQVFERLQCPLLLRFYDDTVRECGSVIITLSNQDTIHDVITEGKKHLDPAWGITGPLRVLEVCESRVHKLCRPETPVRSLACFNKSNIFYHCLRIEADPDTAIPEGHRLVEVYHLDRQSQQAFAQPLLLTLAPGEKSGSVKARCKAKLQVADAEFKSWRLVRAGRTGKVHMKDDEAWDADLGADAKLCLEHVHPCPTNSLTRQSRYNKPLTIK